MWRTGRLIALTAVVVAAGFSPAVAAPSRDGRYDVILTRRIFGAPPPPPPPKAAKPPPPAKRLPPLEKVLRLTSILQLGDDDFLVYLEYLPEKTYLSLHVGDTDADTDITLVQADYAAERVQVGRGDEKQWIKMFGALQSSGSPAKAVSAEAAGRKAGRRPVPASRHGARPPPKP